MAILRKEEIKKLALRVSQHQTKEIPASVVRDLLETLTASRKRNETLSRRCTEYGATLDTIRRMLEAMNEKEALRNMPKNV